MSLNAFKLAERARLFEDNGKRYKADLLRQTLDRHNCYTEQEILSKVPQKIDELFLKEDKTEFKPHLRIVS